MPGWLDGRESEGFPKKTFMPERKASEGENVIKRPS